MGALGLITLAAGLILEVWLAALLMRRNIPHLFPIFFAYVAFLICASASQIAAYSNYRTYYFVYWGTEAVSVLLATLALMEVFRWLFALFWLRWWFRGFLYVSIVLALVLTISNAVLNPPALMHPVSALIYSYGIAVNFMQLAIFAIFWLFSKRLQLGF